jgi:hypothetical protein
VSERACLDSEVFQTSDKGTRHGVLFSEFYHKNYRK